MNKRLFILLYFLSISFINAQYTEVINSNRPGFSESPYSVGTGVYQFESNLFYRSAETTPLFSIPESYGLNLDFRTTFFLEKLEINLKTAVQNDKIAFKNIFESSRSEFGFSKFTLGAKYLVYAPTYTDKGKEIRSFKKRHAFDWRRWIPHVGVYAGVNFGSLLNTYHEQGGISPRVGILLQNEFSFQFNLITNIYYDYIGTDYSELSYIVTATYNINDQWSVFGEAQRIHEKYENKTNLGIGAAYLINRNLQVNTHVRGLFERENLGFYTGIGASYRLDRHRDKFTEIDEFGNKIEEQEEKKYTQNKGFFGRLFDKIGKLFKKKDKNVDLDVSEEKKKELEEEPKTNSRRKRQKSLIDEIAKEDKKDKKKTAKKNKKETKRAKKQAEKERKKLEKDAEKERKRLEKDAEKERKRLEKEAQKEVERKEKERKDLEKQKQKEAEQKLKDRKKLEKEKEKERKKLEEEIKKLEKEIEKEDKEKAKKKKNNKKDDSK